MEPYPAILADLSSAEHQKEKEPQDVNLVDPVLCITQSRHIAQAVGSRNVSGKQMFVIE